MAASPDPRAAALAAQAARQRDLARYGSLERKSEMAQFLAYRGFVGREPGRSAPSSETKALETLDSLDVAQLTLLELRMQSARVRHESDWDASPFSRG